MDEAQETDEVVESHDGTDWQLLVDVGDDELAFHVQHRDGDSWVTAQHWTRAMPNPHPRRRRQLISSSAREHGWVLAHDRWPRMHRRRLTLTEIFPWDWELIVRDATAHRTQALQEAALADRAWRMTLLAAQNTGHMRSAGGRGGWHHEAHHLPAQDRRSAHRQSR